MGQSEGRMVVLAKRRFKIWREVVTVGDFVRGSVVVLRRPCTRALLPMPEAGTPSVLSA